MASGFSKWGNDLYTGKRSYDIVGHRKYFFIAAAVTLLACLAILGIKGLNLGIEFRGGSQFTISNAQTSDQGPAIDAVASVDPSEVARVSTLGTSALRVQTNTLTDLEVQEVRTALAQAYGVTSDDVASSFVGPTWGQDVSAKAFTGIFVFLALVMLVMSLYFRAWRMAAAAILALFHDLIITLGVYAIIGWEVTPASIIGLLTILAYSIYDTVVVFDKVRENTEGITEQYRHTYAERSNLAVNQTMVRSINTSVVALLPVGAILFIGAFLLGAGTLRDISLALFVGMGVGAYSSIFLATPLEVALRSREKAISEHTAQVFAARDARDRGEDPSQAIGASLTAGGDDRDIVPGVRLANRAQPRRKKK
ncbi:protein translocase subunit SecF [Jonesia quinghaiensis]|uniref:protein translocase subunit SecF n=1 Tax=Jonesia quinghaiensis TaxID=262806 RepID=UPI00040F3B9C|nr:protein translocase subunit SecF [Jonesia quinghaiensis]